MRQTHIKSKVLSIALAFLITVTMTPCWAIMTTDEASATDGTVVAKIGDNTYTTLNKAFEAVKDKETIELQSNVEFGKNAETTQINIGDSKTVFLNLNGYTVTGSSGSMFKLQTTSTLTLKDSSNGTGEIVAGTGDFFTIGQDCTVNITGGTYIYNEDEGVANYKGTGTPTFTITGGTFNFDPTKCSVSWSEFNCVPAEGYKVINNGNGTWTVKEKVSAVAQIGGTKYETLQAAIDAATDNDVIKILVDEIDLPLILKDNITFEGLTDQDGKPATRIKTVCFWEGNLLNYGCIRANNITIKNMTFDGLTDTSSKNVGNGNNQLWIKNMAENSTFTMENCYVEDVAVSISNGNAVIENCKFKNGSPVTTQQDTAKSGFARALQFWSLNAGITVNNCKFEGAVYSIHGAGGSGALTVTGGELDGAVSTVADVTSAFNEVTFEEGASLTLGNGTVTGCEFKATTGEEVDARESKVVVVNNNCTVPEAKELVDLGYTLAKGLLVFNGVMDTNEKYTDGIFVSSKKDVVDAAIAEGKTAVAVEDRINTYTISDAMTYVAQVTDKDGKPIGDNDGKYETLQAAINAFSGDAVTIKMLDDETVEFTEPIIISKGKAITLDLNGKTVKGIKQNNGKDFIRVENGSDLTIKDTSQEARGKLTSNAYDAATVFIEGNVTLESGTVESTGSSDPSLGGCVFDVRPNDFGQGQGYVYANNQTNLIINGGTVRGNNSNTIRLASSAVLPTRKDHTVKAVMNGGIIENGNDAFFVQLWTGIECIGKLEIEINGGEIKCKQPVRAFSTSWSRNRATPDEGYIKVSINGGKIRKTENSKTYWKGVAVQNIKTGGTVENVESFMDVSISGGYFSYNDTLADGVVSGKKVINTPEGPEKNAGYIYTIGDATRIVNVNTTETLQQALDNAQKGDTIVCAAGTYETVYLRNNGTESNRIMEDVTVKAAEGVAVNIEQIANQQIAGKTLDIENLTIDGLTFSNKDLTGVNFDYNQTDGKGTLRVNGLTVQNCIKVGDNSQGGSYEQHNFVAFHFDANACPTDYAGNSTLKCGYHNITIQDNIITNVYWPITFPNNDQKSNLTVTGNTFDGCTDNHIQISGSNYSGTTDISNNTVKNMTGRFARIAGATADSSFTIANNAVETPKKYDTGGDADIVKITGAEGFTVTDTNNGWTQGNYTSEAKTTWIANGIAVAKIIDAKSSAKGYYGSLAAAFAAATTGDTIELLKDCTTDKAVLVDKSVTLDLCGHTVKPATDWQFVSGNGNSLISVRRGAVLTIDDSSESHVGKISTAADSLDNVSAQLYSAIGLTIKNEGENGNTAGVVIENGTIEGYYYGITGNGSRHNTSVTINGGTVKGLNADDCVGIYNPQNGIVTLNGGTITGADGIDIKGGTLNVPADSKVQVSATGSFKTPAEPGTSGVNQIGAAIYIEDNYTPVINVNIAGGTFTSTNGNAIAEGFTKTGKTAAEVDISGGLFKSAQDKAVVTTTAVDVYTISGGHFSSEPAAAYIADGKKAIDDTEEFKNLGYNYTIGFENIITVTSGLQGNESTTVAPVSGGGKYSTGDRVTLSAPDLENFDFVGWYNTNPSGHSTGSKLNADGEYEYTFTVQESAGYIALYRTKSSDQKVNIKVESKCRSTDEVTATGTVSINGESVDNKDVVIATEEVTLKAEAGVNTRFICWQNNSGAFVSTEATYTTTVLESKTLTALFATEGAAIANFKDESGNLLSAGLYFASEVEKLQKVLAPSKKGFKFNGWAGETGNVLSDNEVKEKIQTVSKGETGVGVVNIQAVYSAIAQYTATVVFVDISDNTPKAFGTPISVTENVGTPTVFTVGAQTTEVVLNFQGYSQDMTTEKIFSTNTKLTVNPEGDVTYYALYSNGDEIKQNASLIVGQPYAEYSNVAKIGFTMTWTLPKNCKLIEAGFNYGPTEGLGYSCKSDLRTSTGSFTMHVIRNTSVDSHRAYSNVFAQAYIKYKDTNNQEVTVISGQIGEIPVKNQYLSVNYAELIKTNHYDSTATNDPDFAKYVVQN